MVDRPYFLVLGFQFENTEGLGFINILSLEILLINFLEAPSLHNLNIMYKTTTLIETEPFIATCNVTAVKNETISYRWIKDDEETVSETEVLSFDSVNSTDAGNYSCRASNIAGHVDKSFTLQVHCKYLCYHDCY